MNSNKLYSLYIYKNGWDAEKGRAFHIPSSHKSVGVISLVTKLGEIKWNDKLI